MYKILLLKRASSTDPLWTPYKTTSEEGTMVDFVTDDISIIETKIKELLETTPRAQIKAIQDIDYEIDIILNESGVIG